jgi:hypothetical protein
MQKKLKSSLSSHTFFKKQEKLEETRVKAQFISVDLSIKNGKDTSSWQKGS